MPTFDHWHILLQQYYINVCVVASNATKTAQGFAFCVPFSTIFNGCLRHVFRFCHHSHTGPLWLFEMAWLKQEENCWNETSHAARAWLVVVFGKVLPWHPLKMSWGRKGELRPCGVGAAQALMWWCNRTTDIIPNMRMTLSPNVITFGQHAITSGLLSNIHLSASQTTSPNWCCYKQELVPVCVTIRKPDEDVTATCFSRPYGRAFIGSHHRKYSYIIAQAQ